MIYLSKESNHFITGELAPIFFMGEMVFVGYISY